VLKGSLITWMLSGVVSLFLLITVRIVHVTRRRERLAQRMSSIWAITCPEQNCAAIVELINIGPNIVVQDCSVQSHTRCYRSCVAVVRRAALIHSSDRADLRVDERVAHESKNRQL
jgi:hypothetical protein